MKHRATLFLRLPPFCTMLRGSERDHENLTVVDDNEDEEETIELHRGGAENPGVPTRPPPSPRRVVSPRTSANGSPRHELRLPTVPLRETFQSVLSATTQVVSHLDTVADSVAEAMSLLQHPFGGGSSSNSSSSQSHLPPHQRDRRKEFRETYDIDPKLQEAKDAQTRLKLQALWQLLLTGFEVGGMDRCSRTTHNNAHSHSLLLARCSNSPSASALGSEYCGSRSMGSST